MTATATATATANETAADSTPTITVHTLPTCVQCDATKRLLNKLGLPYELIALDENPDIYEEMKARGHMRAPVVTLTNTDGQIIDDFAGFRPDRIKPLAKLEQA